MTLHVRSVQGQLRSIGTTMPLTARFVSVEKYTKPLYRNVNWYLNDR
jgi:hypothetical protein